MAGLPDYLQPRYKKNLKRRFRTISVDSASTSEELPTTFASDPDIVNSAVPIKQAKNSEMSPLSSFASEAPSTANAPLREMRNITPEEREQLILDELHRQSLINGARLNSIISCVDRPGTEKSRSNDAPEALSRSPSPACAIPSTPDTSFASVDEREEENSQPSCAFEAISRSPSPAVVNSTPDTSYTSRDERTPRPTFDDDSDQPSSSARSGRSRSPSPSTIPTEDDSETDVLTPLAKCQIRPFLKKNSTVSLVDGPEEEESQPSGASAVLSRSRSCSPSTIPTEEDSETDILTMVVNYLRPDGNKGNEQNSTVALADELAEESYRSNDASEAPTRSLSPAVVNSTPDTSFTSRVERTPRPTFDEDSDQPSSSTQFGRSPSPPPMAIPTEDDSDTDLLTLMAKYCRPVQKERIVKISAVAVVVEPEEEKSQSNGAVCNEDEDEQPTSGGVQGEFRPVEVMSSIGSCDDDSERPLRERDVVDSSEDETSSSENSSERSSRSSSPTSVRSDDVDDNEGHVDEEEADDEEEDEEIDVVNELDGYSFRSDSASEVISRSLTPLSVVSRDASYNSLSSLNEVADIPEEEEQNPALEELERRSAPPDWLDSGDVEEDEAVDVVGVAETERKANSASPVLYRNYSPPPLLEKEASIEYQEEATGDTQEVWDVQSASAELCRRVLTEDEEEEQVVVDEAKKPRANSDPSVAFGDYSPAPPILEEEAPLEYQEETADPNHEVGDVRLEPRGWYRPVLTEDVEGELVAGEAKKLKANIAPWNRFRKYSPPPPLLEEEAPLLEYHEETADLTQDACDEKSTTAELRREFTPPPLLEEEAPIEYQEEAEDQSRNMQEVQANPAELHRRVLIEDERKEQIVVDETKKFKAKGAPSAILRPPPPVEESLKDRLERQLREFLGCARDEIQAIYDSIPYDKLHEFHEQAMASANALVEKYRAMDELEAMEAAGGDEMEA